MTSLIRFFNGDTTVCVITIESISVCGDLLKWLTGHNIECSIEHTATIYRLYARNKYGHRMYLHDERPHKTKIAWRYDIYWRFGELCVNIKDNVLGVKLKGAASQMHRALAAKN